MEDSVKERIKKFLRDGNIKAVDFCESINVSSGFISGMRESIQPDKLKIIAIKYPNLCIGWLMTGEGDMIKKEDCMKTLLIDKEPNIVYHYTTLECFLSIISNFRFKCSLFEKANDYKEKSSINEMKFNGRPYDKNMRYISFSHGPYSYRNPQLWCHYGNNHAGVCIGIDISKINKSKVDKGKVIYERGINNDKYSQEEYMMRKTPEWKGEWEYRLLFLDGGEYFDIRDCLHSVCFGREVKDDVIRNISSKTLTVNVNIFKIDGSCNGYLGRHSLYDEEGNEFKGKRLGLEELDCSIIDSIRVECEMLKEASSASPSVTDSSLVEELKAEINQLKGENRILREQIGLGEKKR